MIAGRKFWEVVKDGYNLEFDYMLDDAVTTNRVQSFGTASNRRHQVHRAGDSEERPGLVTYPKSSLSYGRQISNDHSRDYDFYDDIEYPEFKASQRRPTDDVPEEEKDINYYLDNYDQYKNLGYYPDFMFRSPKKLKKQRRAPSVDSSRTEYHSLERLSEISEVETTPPKPKSKAKRLLAPYEYYPSGTTVDSERAISPSECSTPKDSIGWNYNKPTLSPEEFATNKNKSTIVTDDFDSDDSESTDSDQNSLHPSDTNFASQRSVSHLVCSIPMDNIGWNFNNKHQLRVENLATNKKPPAIVTDDSDSDDSESTESDHNPVPPSDRSFVSQRSTSHSACRNPMDNIGWNVNEHQLLSDKFATNKKPSEISTDDSDSDDSKSDESDHKPSLYSRFKSSVVSIFRTKKQKKDKRHGH